MIKTITTEKIPIKLWLVDIEEGAMKQVRNIANFPFAYHHVAIMPDAHEGYGMPIGGVLATKKVIIPNAVGVDIGCGVCAQKTSLTQDDLEMYTVETLYGGMSQERTRLGAFLRGVMADIRKAIPLGFEKHKESQGEELMPKLNIKDSFIRREWNNALKSLGSLGGGNHFIEIQKGSDGFVWIMLHSGSRNLGKQVADYYNHIAMQECRKKGFDELVKQELSFLELESETGKKYFAEMSFCVEYALANRKLMMQRIKDIFERHIDISKWGEFINIAHNYASIEPHFGEEVIVHRKGATKAFNDQIGIIPGSQGSKSYIIKGLGNPESFMSCSHGAGRKMGRKQAIRELDFEAEKNKLDQLGIIHAFRGKRDLEEASGAYKDISEVMKNQDDLTEIKIELAPLAVIKG